MYAVPRFPAPIGAVLSDFSAPDGATRFADGQRIVLAGLIMSVRTRPTRNKTLMSYVQLEDETGSMELLVFQRVLEECKDLIKENTPVFAEGRISVRDEKEPQLMAEGFRPMTAASLKPRPPEPPPPQKTKPAAERIWVRLPNREDKRVKRIGLILEMFPGTEQQLILYFEDTKKRAAAPCLIHDALIEELKDLAGEENVVVK